MISRLNNNGNEKKIKSILTICRSWVEWCRRLVEFKVMQVYIEDHLWLNISEISEAVGSVPPESIAFESRKRRVLNFDMKLNRSGSVLLMYISYIFIWYLLNIAGMLDCDFSLLEVVTSHSFFVGVSMSSKSSFSFSFVIDFQVSLGAFRIRLRVLVALGLFCIASSLIFIEHCWYVDCWIVTSAFWVL